MREICYFGKARDGLMEGYLTRSLVTTPFLGVRGNVFRRQAIFLVGEKFMRQLRMRDGRRTAERRKGEQHARVGLGFRLVAPHTGIWEPHLVSVNQGRIIATSDITHRHHHLMILQLHGSFPPIAGGEPLSAPWRGSELVKHACRDSGGFASGRPVGVGSAGGG